jgi:hypothetical protein
MEMPENGPWHERVTFAGGTAFRPRQVIVPAREGVRASQLLAEAGLLAPRPPTPTKRDAGGKQAKGRDGDGGAPRGGELVAAGRFVRFRVVRATLSAVRLLRRAGLRAQVNHVLFASPCCPPHPSSWGGWPPLSGSPYGADPYAADPYAADPYGADPYAADAGGGGCGCGCRCGCGGGGTAADPYGADPYGADPYAADPYAADAPRLPVGRSLRAGGRRSSAQPAKPVKGSAASPSAGANPIRVAVLDTGWLADSFQASSLPKIDVKAGQKDRETPDQDGPGVPGHGYLDPVGGHGTFIAGLIAQHAPGCVVQSRRVLGGYGDGDEVEVAEALIALGRGPKSGRPHVVNLSFGTYTPSYPYLLASAIDGLLDAGMIVVAAAGNDATCVPQVPAALPGVIGVGALHGEGPTAVPASFTNYGPWVRACAKGVDLVSTFFEFDGDEKADDGGDDPDRFEGWAKWSGTSFAAPVVAARIAAHLQDPQKTKSRPANREQALAVEHAVVPVDDPDLFVPGLGTRVD